MEGGSRKSSGGNGAAAGSSSSSSSSINELFGPKGASSSTKNTGIFDSVFSQPSKYSRSEVVGSWRKKDSENQGGWKSKQETPGNPSKSTGSQGQGAYNKGQSSIFQDEGVEPHYLSSSIYYGGQDVCSNPSDTRSSPSAHTYKKDEQDDDPNGSNLHSASRGNWWQGGLYY
ncbi:E3 ubiquitin-protein ligase rlim-like protein [Thalictrum thalictroides]|uniref:E3 ubiquitin-protein ligase rlim-like protein n=1 Tax=Thalictrum thalictroides TaxID=46969 RepID=A0A7J6W4S1_THATH|nr:E3 ubiquitin-protein ligase rlim-like protein [Thalictrum thalictroides]